ncbi:M20/M25/M40 family metallo-hydrolase [Limosilactobacillus sp.]|uniref:M20/M25/M40 family metallo-hydrolase n=1 Tax=Limosilactobacillus sp. TaxID=2773925 RepID=UPI00345E7075
MANQKDEVQQFVVDDLANVQHYLEIPSVSTENRGIPEVVAWLSSTFKDLGANRIEQWNELGGNPVIFAEFSVGKAKTLLFYNHYDVQPEAPLDLWHTKPFEPTIKDGKLFARGASDDKGELMSRLSIVKYYQQHGGLPCNLKFVVEGEEEIGSPHIDDYVAKHANDLKADACIWEGGTKNERDRFQVTCGMKGIFTFDMKVTTADKDIHSSQACYIDNAAWRLVKALNSLLDDQGNIDVDGFYDDVVPLDNPTKDAIDKMDFDAERIKKHYGLKRPFITKNPKRALVQGSTLTINGLSSGFEGQGNKTILPHNARAKLDCRLFAGQKPHHIFDLIRKQLDHNGYSDVEMSYAAGEEAFLTPLTDPFVRLCQQTAKTVYGDDNYLLVPDMPGGGPGRAFQKALNLPIVLVGIHYSGSDPHSPNENIRLEDYRQGSYYLYQLLKSFGK